MTNSETKCSICNNKIDEIKENKIVEYSKLKFWKIICYSCQKNI